MSKFFRDFEKDYNDIHTKGFLCGGDTFDYKIKLKPSENILLKAKLGLNYSYRIEDNQINSTMNDGINAQNKMYEHLGKFKFSNAVLRNFEFKPNLINKDRSFNYKHQTTHDDASKRDIITESI